MELSLFADFVFRQRPDSTTDIAEELEPMDDGWTVAVAAYIFYFWPSKNRQTLTCTIFKKPISYSFT